MLDDCRKCIDAGHMATQTGLLLQIYSQARRAKLLERPWFQTIFQSSYFMYKRFLEDPFHNLGRSHPELFARGNILDVGANIGYTSFVFSKLLTKGFKVFAFEPEPANFSLLQKMVRNRGLEEEIDAWNVAVGQSSGVTHLWLNEMHHADHRIVTENFKAGIRHDAETIRVPMVSIDEFVKERQLAPISFIKIDVQGYELPVLKGLRQTLRENQNAVVAFEYAQDSANELGFDPHTVLEFFTLLDFRLYTLRQDGSLQPLGDKVLDLTECAYINIVASRTNLQVE